MCKIRRSIRSGGLFASEMEESSCGGNMYRSWKTQKTGSWQKPQNPAFKFVSLSEF